jgi:hypothetical protein
MEHLLVLAWWCPLCALHAGFGPCVRNTVSSLLLFLGGGWGLIFHTATAEATFYHCPFFRPDSLLLTHCCCCCLALQPLQHLSPSRPHSSVFNVPLIVSVALQFIIHLYFLTQAVALCVPYLEE